MGKRGPQPTPTAVLDARGSWRAKTRAGEPEPELVSGQADAPVWISKRARKYWPEISDCIMAMGIYTVADRVAAGLLADALGEYIALRDDVAKAGLKNLPVAKAYLVKGLRTDLVRLAREFGLTPASRPALAGGKREEGDKLGDLFDAAG